MTTNIKICKACGKRTLKVLGYQAHQTHWRCTDKACGHEEYSKPRKKDIEKLTQFKHDTPGTNVHRVWFEFEDAFKKRVPIPGAKPYKVGKKKLIPREEKWRWTGYDLMCRVEKWAEKYPRDVTLTSCDDDQYMGSRLVLIQHRAQTGKNYHGTTMLFLNQDDKVEPTIMFLYPGHHDQLLKALTGVKKRNQDWKYA